MTNASACERFRGLAADLVLGVDLPEAEGPWRSHLAGCEDCESFAVSLLWQDRVLSELGAGARMERLLVRVRAAVEHTTPQSVAAETPPPMRMLRSRRRSRSGPLAAAAALALALAGWAWFRKADPAPVAAPPREPAPVAGTPRPEPPAPEPVRETPPPEDPAPTPPPAPAPSPAVAKTPPREAVPVPVAPPAPKEPVARPLRSEQIAPLPAEAAPRTPEQAVRLAMVFLKGKCDGLGNLKLHHDLQSDELMLWTMMHGGTPESDPQFQRLLKSVLDRKLERTYTVALQAMVLEELDRVKHQARIWQCAQFLADNQARNGQWSYGDPTIFAEDVPAELKAKPPPSKRTEAGGKPKVVRFAKVLRKREGPDAGDHSNSMYAALGLRACAEAGVYVPRETLELASKAWRDAQHKVEGGWCYGRHEAHKPYGSMTAGGVGSLAIYDSLLGRDWRKDRDLQAGMDWLAKNFSVTWNPGVYEHAKAEDSGHQLYYYLYALERAAVLSGAEQIAKRDWHAEGSKALLASQKADGSWQSPHGGNEVFDTCFAVLFLQKATRPLPEIPSGRR